MVSGMTCAGCAHSAQNIAESTTGMSNPVVRYASGSLRAEVDWDQFQLDHFADQLRQAGYILETEKITPKERLDRKAKALKAKRLELVLAGVLALPLLIVGMAHLHALWSILFQGAAAGILSFYFGRKIHSKAWALLKMKTTNMDTLVSLGSLVAYFYSLFSAMTGSHHIYFESAGLIIFFILIGKYFEELGKAKNEEALKALIDMQPQNATLSSGEQISIDALEIDDQICVGPAERIPADGVIVEGYSTVDESTFTGEPLPVDKRVGSTVLAGTINGNGTLIVSVSKTGFASALGSVIESVVEAQSTEAPIEALTDRISKIFVPTILVLSALTFFIWNAYSPSSTAILFAIDVLVIACPCALGLATPLAMVAAMGLGSKNGLLIRNAAALQKAPQLQYALLDKTGTLTEGKPEVVNVEWSGPSQPALLRGMNVKGNHPLNIALRHHLEEGDTLGVKRFKAVPGMGVEGKVDGITYYLGSSRYFAEVTGNTAPQENGTTSFLFNENELIAVVHFQDRVKEESLRFITRLKQRGVIPVLLSGDAEVAVERVAAELGIEYYHGGQRPQEKVAQVAQYQRLGTTAMIGDGINDTAALAKADIGISLADATDAAQQSADVVFMYGSLNQLDSFLTLGKGTIKTIHGNLLWAFGYNLVAIPLAAGVLYPSLGISLSPMVASIAMSFSSIGVVLNSLRMHKLKLS
ncbi:MAG: hypothetical protein RL754_107 [Bacteroidota bacterium]